MMNAGTEEFKKLQEEFFSTLEENLSKAEIAFKAFEKGYNEGYEDAKNNKPHRESVSAYE